MSNAQLKQTKNYNRKKNRREKRPKTETYNEKKTNMVDVNPIISIIILSINNLNTSKTEIIRMDQKMTQLYVIYKKPTLSLFF